MVGPLPAAAQHLHAAPRVHGGVAHDPLELLVGENPGAGRRRQDPAAADDVTTLNNLYLPVNKDVVLYLSSKDVIHSFFLPFMRVKHDTIPGQVVPVWFKALKTGDSEIGCAQLCGLSHFRMRGFLHIQEQAAYDTWLAEQVAASAAAASAAAGAAGG